jgi:peptidoglycan biosynthesis protein MviN/MurJ (putative lipid II flippase)
VASAYGWVTIAFSMVNEHIHYILTSYGPTPPSFSITTERKHSHKDINLVEELSLGFLVGAVTIALSLGLLAGAVAETLILFLRHLK